MHGSRTLPGIALVIALAVGVLAAAPSCGGGSPDKGLTLGSGDGGDDGSALEGGDDGFVLDVGDRTIVSIAITPADATIKVTNAKAPTTLTLNAVATFADGSTGNVPAAWAIDRFDIASIGGSSGVVTPSGSVGGVANVTATVNGKSAKTTVTVDLALTVNASPGIDDATKKLLTTATTPDPSVKSLLYPYDKTVFPKGLSGPEVMWNGGAAGDVYLLRLTGPHVSIDIFANADPPSVMAIDDATWNTLTATATSAGSDGALTAELRRTAPAGVGFLTAKATWTVANANVRGTIYYWAVNRGEIVKITPGAAAPTTATDVGSSSAIGPVTPYGGSAGIPATPWQDNGTTDHKICVACHAVSKDGSRLAGVWSTPRGSTGPTGFVDLSTGTTNAIAPYAQNTTFMTLTPDGSKAIANTGDNRFKLVDAKTGAPLVGTDGDMGVANVDDPAFSNDGTKLAFAGNANAFYPVEFCESDLQVASWNSASNTLGAPMTVLSGSHTLGAGCGAARPIVGDAIAFPSWSPDSKWLFYQRGQYSRAKYGACDAADHSNCWFGQNDLYAVSAGGGGTQIRLANANGDGVLDADNAHLNYQPTVNPIAEGGYFWVVFVSVRDYGNKMVSARGGTPLTNATYSNRKQLWVAAIDASMKGPDPSHPAFRLPGQLLSTVNMNGYWTLSPCKPTPTDGSVASCSAGFECCSGFCRDVPGKGPACVDAPTGCHATGDKCSTASDCCDSTAACVGGFCSTAPR